MGDAPKGDRTRVAFSLRVKITLTFLLIGSLASILLALGIVTILQRSMFAELQNRVSGLARIGVELVDVEAFQRLLARISPDIPGDDAIAVEDSADFRSISDALNAHPGDRGAAGPLHLPLRADPRPGHGALCRRCRPARRQGSRGGRGALR